MFETILNLLRTSTEITSTGVTINAYHKDATPTTDAEEELYKAINTKYCNDSSTDTLLIDMIVINLTADNAPNTKDSVFFKVEALKRLYIEAGADAVIKTAAENIKYALYIKDQADSTANSLDKYENIKDKLILRPLNYDMNASKLDGCFYEKIGDIALTLYAIVLDDQENGILNTIKIPENIIETWDRTAEEVYTNALENTNRLYKPRLYTNIFDIDSTPIKNCALMETGYAVTELNSNSVTLLTTDRKTNGAIAAFIPGVLERISKLYGNSDFYVAFTSMHEAMIHKYGSIEPAAIKRNVTETNRIFGDTETLSNAVWLLSAIQAVKAAELKYYDCRHQAIIEDDYSKFVFMPIAKMYFDKNNRKKWTISTPADHAFIYVDKNGVPEVIDRRPAAEPQEKATA